MLLALEDNLWDNGRLTVKVGFATVVEVDDSASAELASSARTTAAASAYVAPIAKRIVLACCLGRAEDLIEVAEKLMRGFRLSWGVPLINNCGQEAANVSTSVSRWDPCSPA